MTDRESTVWQQLRNLGRPLLREQDRELVRQHERERVMRAFHKAWGAAKDAPRTGDVYDYDKQAFAHVQFWLDQVLSQPDGSDR